MPLPGEGDCRPRLCTLRKWDNFAGYGFNLQAEKGKPGQFIGYVDSNSPADACGLRKNDRVIEVNGVNVCNESHKQVVARIRENPDEVSLLVMDPVTEKHFLENGIVVKGSMDIVEKHEVSQGLPSNGVTAVSERERTPTPTPLPEEPTAEAHVTPATETTVEHDEAELVKETEELNVQETTEETPAETVKEEEEEEEEKEKEEEVVKVEEEETPQEEEKVEEKEAEVELPARVDEAPAAEEPENPVEEEVTSVPISEDSASCEATVSNSGDVENSTPAVNNATEASPAPVTVYESAPPEAASSALNGDTRSADPMSIFQMPASEVRAMHGRSKRRAIKETNQTFKEKYLMFESL